MVSTAARIVARVLWFVPALLLFLTLYQAKAAFDLRATWQQGTPAAAEVYDYKDSNRADVTYGYVSLRIPLAAGQVLTREKLALPKTLLPRLAGEETLEVRVRPGAAQEVVIAPLMPAHWLIAAAQSGMALMGALLFAAGVFWWNRFLRRQGDPARREMESAIKNAS